MVFSVGGLKIYAQDTLDLSNAIQIGLENNFDNWVEAHKNDSGWDFEKLERIWKEREAVLTRELE